MTVVHLCNRPGLLNNLDCPSHKPKGVKPSGVLKAPVFHVLVKRFKWLVFRIQSKANVYLMEPALQSREVDFPDKDFP